ncbi:hypothetical protein D3C77_594060 [compost metagenome]
MNYFVTIPNPCGGNSSRSFRLIFLEHRSLHLPPLRNEYEAYVRFLKALQRNDTNDSIFFGQRNHVDNSCSVVLPLKLRNLMHWQNKVLSPLCEDEHVVKCIHLKDVLHVVAILHS